MSFGGRLKEARMKKKLTQTKVAEIIGIDDTTISKYENNKSEPDNETLTKLSRIYNCSIDYLMGKTDNPKQKESIDEIERRLLEEFDKLSQEDKDYVIGLIRKIQKE